MTTKIEAPVMGESISEATVADWSVKEGDIVTQDQLIAELETDKVNLEVVATAPGKITKILTPEGATVHPGDVMAELDESAAGETPAAGPVEVEEVTEEPAPSAPTASANNTKSGTAMPAAARAGAEAGINTADVVGTGKDGRVTKKDVMNHTPTASVSNPAAAQATEIEADERVPISRIRKTIAARLKTAQNSAALLTTYNEVDLLAVNNIRKQYKDKFLDKHGVKLGYMSFFTKAACEALKFQPAINAEMTENEIIYKKQHNIGIAVSSDRGLVVPVVRNASKKSFAEIEQDIMDYAVKARSGKLMPDDMSGATFTITNGGTFGSLMSMPILNYPQVGILGMHAIKERPVVVDGEITIRPMMYLALTYDHRVVDGKEAVTFLVKIKELLEDPSRLMLEL